MKRISAGSQKVIIIIGPPGSGKGTQANLLADRFGFYHLESSKVIEASFNVVAKESTISVNGKKYPLSEEKRKWRQGLLCTPAVVAFLIKNKIKLLAERGESLIFSGSLRTLYEAQELFPVLKELYGLSNIKVISLVINLKESVFRNSHRKICELMRHPVLYSKETEKLAHCPLDGSKLKTRKGLDDPDTILVRLERFKKETFPVLGYLRSQKVKIAVISGSPAPAKVFQDILKALKLKGVNLEK